jgi:hypothetical protein
MKLHKMRIWDILFINIIVGVITCMSIGIGGEVSTWAGVALGLLYMRYYGKRIGVREKRVDMESEYRIGMSILSIIMVIVSIGMIWGGVIEFAIGVSLGITFLIWGLWK